MKKIAVLILTIAVLSTALCSALGVSALDAYLHDAGDPVFNLDLSNVDNASKVGKEGITAHAYDDTEGALKVYPSAATGKAPARLVVTYDNTPTTTAAPVIAVIYKSVTDNIDPEFSTKTSVTANLKNAGAVYGKANGETTTTKVTTYGVLNQTKAPQIVDLGNGYKLLVADVFEADYIYAYTNETTVNPLVGKTSAGKDITMLQTIVDFFPYSSKTFTPDDAFFVKSVALFDSIDTAKSYYGAQVDNYKVFDFGTAENFEANKGIFTSNNAASFEYDANAGAGLITPNIASGTKESANFFMKPANAGYDIDPAEYPYISMKIRLADETSEFGKVTGYTTASTYYYEAWTEKLESKSVSTNHLDMAATYEATTDWQILTVSAADSKVQTSKYPYDGFSVLSHTEWQQILIQFSPYNKCDTESELYWIEWIGFFRDADDAAEYDRMTESVKYYGVQNSSVRADSKYDMRFISTIDAAVYENYDAIGMEIIATSNEGTYDLSKEVNSVYKTLNAKDGENNMIKVELDGKYLVAVTVGNIPLSAGTVTYKVTPYVVKDSVRYTGDSYTVSFIGTDATPAQALR